MTRRLKYHLLLACLAVGSVAIFFLGHNAIRCQWQVGPSRVLVHGPASRNLSGTVLDDGGDMPLIFVGGILHSGTTLVRAMLNAHPEVRCREETQVITGLLAARQTWSQSESERLDQAGVTTQVLDSAMRAFLLEVIVRHGEPAARLCNKEPSVLQSLSYLARLFPHAKFVLVIRDGRAVAHSMISRQVTVDGFNLHSYRDCLAKWSAVLEAMYGQCLEAGGRCLPLRYERLVLHPEAWMRRLFRFLDLPWNDTIRRHVELVGKTVGISLSKAEHSMDHVVWPVNTEGLSRWVGNIPADVLEDMADIAPMLARLGYDPLATSPKYVKLDRQVIDNTKRKSLERLNPS